MHGIVPLVSKATDRPPWGLAPASGKLVGL